MKAWSVRSWTAYALLLVLPAMALSTVYSGDLNTLCNSQCINSSDGDCTVGECTVGECTVGDCTDGDCTDGECTVGECALLVSVH